MVRGYISTGTGTPSYLGNPDCGENCLDMSCVDWKPTGDYAYFVGDLGADRKWHPTSGYSLPSQRFPETGTGALAWRPDSAEILVGGTCGRLWKYTEAAGHTTLRDTGEASDRIRGFAWQPDSKYAIVTGYDFYETENAVALVYDPSDSSLHRVHVEPKDVKLERAAWRPNGKYAVAAGR